MKHLNKTLASLVLAALTAGGMAATTAMADEQTVRGRDLMSTEEWQAHSTAMRSMSTDQERRQYRAAVHEQMSQRAAEQGKTLAGGPSGKRGGYGYGAMDSNRRGYGPR